MSDLMDNVRRAPYPAISAETLAGSQNERNIIITGGGSGIGLATSFAFVRAGAQKVIIVGRRQDVLKDAQEQLSKLIIDDKTEILPIVSDVSNLDNIAQLWQNLRDSGTNVDVLVLNAADAGARGRLVEVNLEDVWNSYELNVRGNLAMVQKFAAQGNSGKVLLNTSSAAAHINPWPTNGVYSSVKLAFANMVQHLASEVPVTEMQAISFHPGAVITEAAKRAGYQKNSGFRDDDPALPGQFAVWASTKEAAFLHGRYVWAAWDVDRLKALKPELERDIGYLRTGLQGIPPIHTDVFKSLYMS